MSGDDYEYEMEIFIDPNTARQDDSADAEAVSKSATLQRLSNLGYGTGEPLDHQVRAFQRDCGMTETGAVEDILDHLNQRHDQCDPPLRVDVSGR